MFFISLTVDVTIRAALRSHSGGHWRSSRRRLRRPLHADHHEPEWAEEEEEARGFAAR